MSEKDVKYRTTIPSYLRILSTIGILYTLQKSFKFLRFTKQYFFTKKKNFKFVISNSAKNRRTQHSYNESTFTYKFYFFEQKIISSFEELYCTPIWSKK